MELHLKIVGALLIALALAHSFFPRYFKWSSDLSGIALINRQMMHVHTFFIAFVLLMIGILCVSSSELLNTTELGHRVAFGLAVFWIARLVIQFFWYSTELWKGKPFETTVHILFSILWVYFCI